MVFPFILRFDQVLLVCLNPIIQNTHFLGKKFLEICSLLLITGGGTMSNISSEGPSEKRSKTAKAFQPILHETE